MSDLSKSYISTLKQTQFVILGIAAALILAAIENKSKFDRAAQELTVITNITRTLTLAGPQREALFEEEIANQLNGITVQDIQASLAAKMDHIVVQSDRGKDISHSIALDWRIPPYLLVDHQMLADGGMRTTYINVSKELPRSRLNCGPTRTRSVPGQASFNANRVLRDQRLLPIENAGGLLTRLRQENVGARDSSRGNRAIAHPIGDNALARINLAQFKAAWDFLDRGQLWVVDSNGLSKDARPTLRPVEAPSNYAVSLMPAQTGQTTYPDCDSPGHRRPPILNAHFPGKPQNSVYRQTAISANVTSALLPRRDFDMSFGSAIVGGARYFVDLPALVLDTRTIQDRLLKSSHLGSGTLNWPTRGTFEETFPNVAREYSGLLERPVPVLTFTNDILRRNQNSNLTILGFSFSRSNIHVFGSLGLLAALVYFAAMLRSFRTLMASGAHPQEVAWLPLIPGRIVDLLIVGGIWIFPIGASFAKAIQELWITKSLAASFFTTWPQLCLCIPIALVCTWIVVQFHHLRKRQP